MSSRSTTTTRNWYFNSTVLRSAAAVVFFVPAVLLALGTPAPAPGAEARAAKAADPEPSRFRVVGPKLRRSAGLKLTDPSRTQPRPEASLVTVKRKLARELPVLGHRNWIVVADWAYPAQSRPGIETVYVGGDQAKTVQAVLQAVDAAKHVRPVVYVDAESKFVSEKDAPGIGAYRKKLAGLLKKRPVKTMPHAEVIANLDEAAKTFRILILKTEMVLPYSTVFIQLECGYWSTEKEKRLREAMEAESK